MNLANYNLDVGLTKPPSRYSIYKRIANLGLVVLATIICVNLWLLSTEQAQNWHDNQANQLGRSLAQQSAMVLAPALLEQNDVFISTQLANLVSDKHVVSAAVFNYRGQLLDSTESNRSLLTNYRLRNDMPLVFIEEIVYQDSVRGYLRVLIEEQQVMVYHDEYQRQLFEQVLVLMGLAGAAGILLARSFYKFRYRRQQAAKATQE